MSDRTITGTEEGEADTVGGADGAATPPGDAGRYRIDRELARGGMGRIMVAHDALLDRTVALKILTTPSAGLRIRFEREVHLTARMQHPGIVPIYDQGRLPGGAPFYAMKLVAGRPLEEGIAARRALVDRLALIPAVLAVADAIAYAHGQRIIHRDLKPLNILVGDFGETLVIDWGLAKQLDEADADLPIAEPSHDGLTVAGTVFGTPAYMAPEQARGEAVDERADVYAIGAILYHVLAGAAPYRDSGRPSVAAVVDGPPRSLAEAQPGVPADLAAIVARAMAREPAQRYRDAGALAADLRRFETGQMVGAYRYRLRERVARWIGRHRAALAVATVLIAVLAVTAIASVQRIARERDRARAALIALAAREDELIIRQAEAALEVDPTAAVAWLARHHGGAGDAARVRAIAEVAAARGVARHVFALDGFGVTLEPDRGGVTVSDASGALWRWTAGADRLTRLAAGLDDVALRAVDRDGTMAIVATRQGAARVELATGRFEMLGGAVAAAAIGPGETLHLVRPDGEVEIWRDGISHSRVRIIGQASSVALSPAGRTLAIGVADGSVWTIDRGVVRLVGRHAREVLQLRFLDERWLLTSAEDGRVQRWDLTATGDGNGDGDSGGAAGQLVGQHQDWVPALAIAPDRRQLASGGGDDVVTLWPLDGGAPRTLRGHGGTVFGLAWSDDGRLASASADGTVRIWSATGDDAIVLAAGGSVRRVAWVGTTVVAMTGSKLRIFEQLPDPARPLPGAAGELRAIAWSPGGRVAAAGRGGIAEVWQVATGAHLRSAPLPGWITALGFAGDDDHLAIATYDSAALWDLASGRALATIATGGGTVEPRLHAGARRVAWIDEPAQRVAFGDLDTGAVTRGASHPRLPADLAVSADGTTLATGDLAGAVRVWPIAGGAPQIRTGAERVARVLISADGSRVVSAPRSCEPLRVWQPATDQVGDLTIADLACDTMVLRPDGTQLIAAADRALLVVELGSDQRRALVGHRAAIEQIALSDDAAWAATSDATGEVRLWRLADGQTWVLRDRQARAASLSFSPDGSLLAAELAGGLVLWPVPRDGHGAVPSTAGWLTELTSARLDDELALATPRR